MAHFGGPGELRLDLFGEDVGITPDLRRTAITLLPKAETLLAAAPALRLVARPELRNREGMKVSRVVQRSKEFDESILIARRKECAEQDEVGDGAGDGIDCFVCR